MLHDFWGDSLSLGSVVAVQQADSTALAPVYAAIHTAVQQTEHCTIDETGWKEAGKRRSLWTMVTAVATFFYVATSRNGPALRYLVGTAYRGIVGSDRHRGAGRISSAISRPWRIVVDAWEPGELTC